MAEKAPEVPQLVEALCEAEVSLDKVRAVLDVATPSTEGELCQQAKGHSVRELVDIARMAAEGRDRRAPAPARSEHDRRYLRFNDTFRTMTVQLPAESYAEAKACLEARARQMPSEAEVDSAGQVASEGEAPSAGTVTQGRSLQKQSRHFSGHGHFSRQGPLGPALL